MLCHSANACFSCAYMQVVETIYRLVLTGLLVLVEQGSALQIVVGFCFAVFFFLCYEHFTPFHDPVLQQLQHISLFQVRTCYVKSCHVMACRVMLRCFVMSAAGGIYLFHCPHNQS